MIDYVDGCPTPALTRLQQLDKTILKHFLEFCQAHGLRGFMVAGSALGAIRHKDIIPWDDDIDVGLIREDYDRFISLYRNDPATGIYLEAAENGDDYYLAFAKLRYRSSAIAEPLFEGTDISKDIYIDIFPFDHLPHSRVWRAVQHGVLFVLSLFIMSTGAGASSWSQVRLFRIARRLAYLLRPVLPIRSMVRWRRAVSAWRPGRKSNEVASFEMYGIRHAKRTFIDERAIFPLREVPFGDMRVPVPGEAEAYLKAVFGDFMRLPPEAQRRPAHALLPAIQKN
jgi:lipopolysaccharide cholinephosphotransferase